MISEQYVQIGVDKLFDIVNPREGDINLRQLGEDEFMTFAKRTYQELYSIESRILGAKSAICLFCRLDIRLIVDKSNKFGYFVNEVERTATASLWSNYSGGNSKSPIGTLGSTFANTLHRWLSDVQDPYTLS